MKQIYRINHNKHTLIKLNETNSNGLTIISSIRKICLYEISDRVRKITWLTKTDYNWSAVLTCPHYVASGQR